MRAWLLTCVIALSPSCAEPLEIESTTAAVVELGEESRLLAAHLNRDPSSFFHGVVARDGDVFAFTEIWFDPPEPDPIRFTVLERSGTVWNPVARFMLPTGTGSPSLAISGDRIVVGAPGDSVEAFQGGAAYVYLRTAAGWAFEQRLTPSTPSAGVLFGRSVAIDGNRLVVGAPVWPGPDFGTGAAFVFERSGGVWLQVAGPLVGADSASGDRLGESVDISGGRIAVGARSHAHGSGFFAGAVYTFVRSGGAWTAEAEIRQEQVNGSGRFGTTVALVGPELLASAPSEPGAQGAAFLFRRVSGTWQQRLRVRGTQLGDNIIAADMSATRMAITTENGVHTYLRDGRWLPDTPLFPAGASDLFPAVITEEGVLVAARLPQHRMHLFGAAGGWQQDGLFAPQLPDGDELDHFGAAVAFDDDTMLVGAPDTESPGIDNGSAYVYSRQGRGWRVEDLRGRRGGDKFGAAVAAVGPHIAVGAPGYGLNEGAVTFYQPGAFGWEILSSTSGFQGMRLGDSLDADPAAGRVVAGGPDLGGGWIGVASQVFGYDMGLWQPFGLNDGDRFGADVAVHGVDIIGGAPGDDQLGTGAGAVHWTDDGVLEFVKITAPDGEAGDAFGSAVDTDGVSLAVAAPLRDGAREDEGAVYLYRRLADGWELDDILVSPDGGLRTRFGSALALNDGLLAVTGDRGRTVYVYQRGGDGWSLAAVRNYAGSATAPRFGWSLAIDAGALLIGASADDGRVPGTGTATRIELSVTP